MKQLNKLLCALLCVIMALCALPTSAGAYSAAIIEKYGDYIDFNELTMEFQAEASARLNIGGLPFWGKLERGAELEDEDIDAALQKALADRSINLTDLAAFEAATKLADEYKEGWTAEKIIKAALKIFGADTVTDVWDIVTGKLDTQPERDKWIAGKVYDKIKGDFINQALQEKAPLLVGKVGLKTAAYSVTCLVNAGEIGLQELWAWLNEGKVLSEGRKAAEELELFYRAANKRLAYYLDKEAGEWEINFDDAKLTRTGMQIFGIDGISQTYTVSGNLVREAGSRATAHENPELTDISGTYTGDLTIVVTHKLYNFDQQLIMLYIETPFYNAFADAGMQFGSMNKKPSYLSDMIYKEDFSVTVSAPEHGGSVSRIPVDFSDFEDVLNFGVGQSIFCAHTDASVGPGGTADGQGGVYGGGGGAWLETSDYIFNSVFEGEKVGLRGLRLKLVGMKEIGTVSGSFEGIGFSDSIDEAWDLRGQNIVIGEDNQLFAELDMNSSLEVGWLVQQREE